MIMSREGTGVMDKLLFGDNQFFGVNHMSEEKARAQAMRFQNLGAVLGVLDAAYESGIRTFMCTTHERIGEVAAHVRDNPHKYSGFQFYPCMPYAHKYANAATELGVIGLLRKVSPEGGLISTAFRSGLSLASRDIDELTRIMIDSELQMFRGVKTPVIFLQNVVVDFLMGIGLTRTFKTFAEHVRERYGAEPGWITMNLPKLLEVLDEQGIENPIVCSNINKIGFRMCGGLPAYQAALRDREFRGIAMSVFASGAIPAKEAIEWVCEQPNIESIVFGASSRSNIQNTKNLVDGAWRTS
jgi:hypothetical protein